MQVDTDELLKRALADGLRDGVKNALTRIYDNPVEKMITAVLAAHDEQFRKLIGDAVASCMGDAAFRADIAAAVRTTLAKVLVQRFGGELEKQVNALKSDPTTRARITLAIEGIVKGRVTA